MESASIGRKYRAIDAAVFFEAAVDACLLVCSISPTGNSKDCDVFPDIHALKPSSTIGFHDDQLIADVHAYEQWKHLAGNSEYQWRSGVKHDCSKVMELRREANGFRNGLDELVEMEDDYLFPMLRALNWRTGAFETRSAG